ncbi:alpha/beta hydrolase fold domain-containing protein [Luteolibacter luteus]|uniref:Alpha/beta hydrolase fold domain-containing protein n=1 Tax=Luteolibacter luteus TaxID=2728835 RepID=A0A858RL11_9BACT|nr:alpha/beta hydrolase fold domain-containing protein [Luteolibacter luteus]QJE97627.1 alpha/beta hydrolase fold domain-containing protein [Luteolibacter luteus]
MRWLLFAVLTPAAFAQADPFAALDKNKDGKLSLTEVPKAAQAHFKRVDANNDGIVTQEEFAKSNGGGSPAPAKGPDLDLLKDIDYVGKGNPRQKLDLLVAKDRATKLRPLVVFIHGGGWLAGSKSDGLGVMQAITANGDYVAASINYRLTQEAAWPAQIFDCKAAIRYLRGNASKYGIDPERIGVMGMSAGGQLVSVLGTSGDVSSLEGDLGSFTKQSSRVQCVVNFFGPANFLTFYGPDTTTATLRDAKMIGPLLGKDEEEVLVNAKSASAVTWITKDDAPFFTAHGTKDDLVPYAQAKEIDASLAKAGVETHLIEMTGAGHGFDSPDLNDRIKLFLDKHLRGREAKIPETPIRVQ